MCTCSINIIHFQAPPAVFFNTPLTTTATTTTTTTTTTPSQGRFFTYDICDYSPTAFEKTFTELLDNPSILQGYRRVLSTSPSASTPIVAAASAEDSLASSAEDSEVRLLAQFVPGLRKMVKTAASIVVQVGRIFVFRHGRIIVHRHVTVGRNILWV